MFGHSPLWLVLLNPFLLNATYWSPWKHDEGSASKRNIGKKGVKLRVSIIISSIASADTYSEPNQTSKIELFAKIVNVES